ncbi:hypothetical protein F0562_022340 [Nyssa sinensis]|uniref:Late embryogenesis abundant protein LEA-2 subgroup domain-containing protein n=1 Tax=Nyssa sinensis TaxID=561372 RepID=A0A5J5BNH1_9ASTE|nr:hypothetical protein F0562_022340 [Nyssa sinensis]
MTIKDCGHYHHHHERRKLYRRLFYCFLTLLIIVGFIILLVWLILRPTKPQFVLQDSTVYTFNVSSSNFVTSNFQITMASRNPNSRIGIYYDKLDMYAAYRGQQITLSTVLPSTYQGHKDENVWSPFLYGNDVPLAPYLGVSLNQDHLAGIILINIKVRGRLRWKVGTFISGRYHLHVNCPVTFGNKNNA